VHALIVTLVLLHGIVMRGPTQPVCQIATPCSEPAAGVLLTFVRSGAAPVRVRTDARGRYSVHLRRGTYVVRVAKTQPRTLVVRRSATADFAIDTGIR